MRLEIAILKIIFFDSDAQKFKEKFEEAKKCMKEVLEKGTHQKLHIGMITFALVDTVMEPLLMLYFFRTIAEVVAKKEGKSDDKESDDVAEKLGELKVKDDQSKDEEEKKKVDSSSDGSDKDAVER